MKRRQFLKNTALGAVSFSPGTAAARELRRIINPGSGSVPGNRSGGIKISLAQWSLHRRLFAGDLDPVDFPEVAMEEYGIPAVEYVNQFYMEQVADEKFWIRLKERADRAGVRNLLIMVDEEGDLGDADAGKRKQAVKNHFKWVHAAQVLGCHSIRVNAFGSDDRELFRTAMVESMASLGGYAAQKKINVIIENHGLFSSDAGLIAEIIREVGMTNCGTLPDFGNWCLSAKYGSTQGDCDEVYNHYRGVEELLPFARGVSAKSYRFDENGDETRIDYYRMLRLVRESGYEGYIGIEYEGEDLGEHEGIVATRKLLEKAWQMTEQSASK